VRAPLTRSFEILWPTGQQEVLIEGTLFPVPNGHHEIAGNCGGRTFESIHDLVNLTRWTAKQTQTFVEHVQNLINTADPKPKAVEPRWSNR